MTECVCTNLKMAGRVVGRAYDAAFEPLGIGSAQYSILVAIRRRQQVALMALAKELEMERTTLYRDLARLTRDGLVKVEAAGAGVAREARLTAKGRAVTAKAERRWRQVHERFVAGFGEAQLERLNEALRQVREQFRP
jgi:DNA-binding MarR family transcriptional regulator